MKIVNKTEQSLEASKSLPDRLVPAVFFIALGGLLLFVAPLSASIICWVLAGFLVLTVILIPTTITVDRSRKEIALRKLSYGPKTRIIPFSAVEAVQVGYRRNLGLASNDWQVTLLLTDRTVAIAHSRNELRIRQLGSAISRLVGVKFVSDTFKPKNTFQDKGAWFYSGIRRPPPR